MIYNLKLKTGEKIHRLTTESQTELQYLVRETDLDRPKLRVHTFSAERATRSANSYQLPRLLLVMSVPLWFCNCQFVRIQKSEESEQVDFATLFSGNSELQRFRFC